MQHSVSKNPNLYPRQSKITLPTLLWDTLYIPLLVPVFIEWPLSSYVCWIIIAIISTMLPIPVGSFWKRQMIHSKVARQCKNCATVSPFGIISRTRAHLSRPGGVNLVPLVVLKVQKNWQSSIIYNLTFDQISQKFIQYYIS